MLNNIEYSNSEIILLIIENILKMLYKRNLIDFDNIKLYLSNINDKKNIFEFKIKNNKTIGVYLLNTSITTIVNGSPLDEYLSENITIPKIVIGKNVSKKVIRQLYQDYKNIEFFFEHDMLIDLPSIIYIPEHKLLNEEELNNLNLEKNLLKSIKLYDMITRYYGGNIGDIFEVSRISENGYPPEYRRVVNSNIDLFFNN